MMSKFTNEFSNEYICVFNKDYIICLLICNCNPHFVPKEVLFSLYTGNPFSPMF